MGCVPERCGDGCRREVWGGKVGIGEGDVTDCESQRVCRVDFVEGFNRVNCMEIGGETPTLAVKGG